MLLPEFSDDSLFLSRRSWIATAASHVGAIAAAGQFAESASAQSKYTPLNRYPRMLHDWYAEQIRNAEALHIQSIQSLMSKEDAQRYIAEVRGKIRTCFGPEPERTPLNPLVTGIVERETYRIEKVIFESRPHFPVTANLYLPKNVDGKCPAVVGTCGHSSNGKAAAPYQSFAQGLARLGIACLIYDPIGQGERIQYTQDNVTSKIGVGVNEHLHAGNQQFLVGDFLGSWHAWDGIRALDYLLSRKEVDSTRVGVTGNSGGGTLTTWLCGLERRWTMAAPACFVTTFRRNFENELPADTEQCPPMALSLGLDHCDFLAAMAPKPIIILAKERDYFDVRGAEEAYRRLKKLYGLLGAEENIALFVGPTEHGYSQDNREAMFSWFAHQSGAKLGPSGKQKKLDGVLTSSGSMDYLKEPPITVETDATLQCTDGGQIAERGSTATVFMATRDKSRQLGSKRSALSGEPLAQALRDALKIARLPDEVPDYRIWRYVGARDYPRKFAVGYSVVTEPGIEAVVYQLTSESHMSRPAASKRKAVLYLPDFSSDEELRTEPMLRAWGEDRGLDVFACDARGVGESQPDTCGPNSFRKPYGSEYFYAIHGLMLNRPLVGQKTFDVLRVLHWLESLGYKKVHLAGVGRGSLLATFAAVLSPTVDQVTLKGSIDSYSAIAETEYYEAPLASLLPNVLASFDLPDCYRELSAKALKRIS
jgi:cephalosporin-C deacetylase-like acetyl esterase